MSAPLPGRRPSRFTFNIPSPAHHKLHQHQHQYQPQPPPPPHAKYPQHPPPPASLVLLRQHDSLTTAGRRKKASTPHPLLSYKPAFVDYSLSLPFSPSFSPSSCVISGVSLPETPTSPTDSPMSDMRQRRWSMEMRRKCDDDDDEQGEEEEDEEEDEDEEQNIISPNVLSSSSCSFLSPAGSSSSLDSPTSPSPASLHSPLEHQPSFYVPPVPTVPAGAPHRRLHSDPLPVPSTSSVSDVAFKLSLRPLVIPHSSSRDTPIVMLSTKQSLKLTQLTDRQCSYEWAEQSTGATAPSATDAGLDELMYGRPMSLAECWYGRSEAMSPVSGAGMMYMAAQQNKANPMPFSQFCFGSTTTVS